MDNKKILTINRDIQIINGNLQGTIGRLVAYDYEEGEVVIEIDNETFIHTNAYNVSQCWIENLSKYSDCFVGNVGGKYNGCIVIAKDNITFTTDNRNYENDKIPFELLEEAKEKQKKLGVEEYEQLSL